MLANAGCANVTIYVLKMRELATDIMFPAPCQRFIIYVAQVLMFAGVIQFPVLVAGQGCNLCRSRYSVI